MITDMVTAMEVMVTAMEVMVTVMVHPRENQQKKNEKNIVKDYIENGTMTMKTNWIMKKGKQMFKENFSGKYLKNVNKH